MWSGTALYPVYAAGEAYWGISPLTDQGIAGVIMMTEGALVVLGVLAWTLLRWAARDAEKQRLLDLAAERGVPLAPERAERAVTAGHGARLEERLKRLVSRNRFLYVLVFTVGISTLGAEIAAARLLAPFFGASTIVWANTIGVVLVALSVGYWYGGRLGDRYPGVRAALPDGPRGRRARRADPVHRAAVPGGLGRRPRRDRGRCVRRLAVRGARS